MKNIYIIDDSNTSEYDVSFLTDSKYANIVKFVKTKEDFDSCKADLLQAACVMVHLTFNSDKKVKEEVLELTNDGEKVPIVFFSGSGNKLFKEDDFNYKSFEKKVFYANIEVFLSVYVETHTVNRLLLTYGKDFYNERNIREWGINVLRNISGKNGLVNGADSIFKSDAFIQLITASQPLIGKSIKEIIVDTGNGKTSYEDFRCNLRNILTSFAYYGKNIFAWR